jgi:hypothetical protein
LFLIHDFSFTAGWLNSFLDWTSNTTAIIPSPKGMAQTEPNQRQCPIPALYRGYATNDGQNTGKCKGNKYHPDACLTKLVIVAKVDGKPYDEENYEGNEKKPDYTGGNIYPPRYDRLVCSD